MTGLVERRGCRQPRSKSSALRLALCWSMLGCDDTPRVSAPECSTPLDEEQCAIEPSAHLVHLTGCRDEGDCPIGSLCRACSTDVTGQVLDATCQVPNPFPARTGDLQRGFEAPAFPRQRLVETDSGRVLQWEAPEGTRFVSCALFTCPPTFSSKDGQASVRVIDNTERCMASFGQYPSRSGTFDAQDPTLRHYPSVEGVEVDPAESECCQFVPCHECDSSPCDGKTNRIISALLVGCWAYDDWGLIAATDLFRLEPDEVFLTALALATGPDGTCSPIDDGRNCWLPESGAFGVCDERQACLHRCLLESDCASVDYCAGEPPRQAVCVANPNDGEGVVGLGTCECAGTEAG